MEISLRPVKEAVELIAPGPGLNNCLLQQFKECISGIKVELEDIAQATLSLKDDEGSLEQHSTLEKALYDLDLKIKRLLYACKSSPSAPEHTAGVKLPKINVPMFDGSILHWYIFLGNSVVSVHSKMQLSEPDMLAYLRHAIKDGPARHVIEGLSQSANNCITLNKATA